LAAHWKSLEERCLRKIREFRGKAALLRVTDPRSGPPLKTPKIEQNGVKFARF
jgi:hypothetical protein